MENKQNSNLHQQGLTAQRSKRGKARIFQDDELRHLVEDLGITQAKIAEMKKCSVSAVERSCKRLGLKTSRTGPRHADNHRDWSGGRRLVNHGYIDVYAPLHPYSKQYGTVPEHRLVMELKMKRYLLPQEVVDHIDNHPRHNSPDNLRVFASNADHLRTTLTGVKKGSPRMLTDDAHPGSQKTGYLPSLHETLEGCPLETHQMLLHDLDYHRPTNEHRTLPRKKLKGLVNYWKDTSME